MHFRPSVLALPAFILFAARAPLPAAPATSLVVFGDSLSDNGNAFLLSRGAFPGTNYGTYTFSNGLQTSFFSDGPNTTPPAAGPAGPWVDQLAAKLAVPDPLPAAALGTNFAVGGALTGTASPTDIGNQVALYSASGVSSSALFTFWGGANDIFDGQNPVTAADNISASIAALHGQGANDFLWLNLPLLGNTPRGQSTDPATLNAASSSFNTEWSRDLAALQSAGIHVTGVDIDSLFGAIIADPAAHGFTNVTTPARGLSIANDAGYLFWDAMHPTTAGHAAVADLAYRDLNAQATPEPASLALCSLSALALVIVLRRRPAQSR